VTCAAAVRDYGAHPPQSQSRNCRLRGGGWLPKLRPISKRRGSDHSGDHSGYHDELSFRRLETCNFRTRIALQAESPRASSPTGGFPKERAASLAPPPLDRLLCHPGPMARETS